MATNAQEQTVGSGEPGWGTSCAVRMVDPDRVAATRERAIGTDEAGEVASLFRILGDPGRVRMLAALLEAGELCVCDLAAVVGMEESTVSHALRVLRSAGIVRHRRAGRQVFYRLDDAHVRLLLDVSLQHVGHGTAAS
ncbi:MAG: ArsR/SmtB family transcription factor [Aquihabitans sp.]